MEWRRLWWLVLLGLMALCMSVRFAAIDHSQTAEWGYVNAGAVNPYYGVTRPLGYRVFMPVILNLSAIIPKPGEPLIPVTAAVLMGICFYLFLRALGFSMTVAAFGSAVLALSGGVTDLLRDFGINNADTSSHIFILVALWAMVKKNDPLFSIATMLGTFNREWALVLIPGWYIYTYGSKLSVYSIISFIRIALPSIGVYLMVRYVYFPHCVLGVMANDLGALMPASETTTLQYYLAQIGQSQWTEFRQRVLSTQFYEFGLIALLPFVIGGWRFCPAAWKRFCAYYTFLCIIQFTFVTDVWRLAFYLFPVVLSLYLYWLKAIGERLSERMQWPVAGLSAAVFLTWPGSWWTLLFGVILFTCAEFAYRVKRSNV